jgi:O-antigen/teichoic acid export membrane protein
MIVIAISAVVALAPLLLVVPVYGEAFRPAIDVGLLLLPGSAVLGISNVLGSSLIGRGFPQYGLYTVAIIVGPTIALYATLIPAWDARGAALASTLSYIFTTLITAFFYRRVTGRNVFCVMVPTRSEWDDLRRLPAAARAWARGLRA